MTDELDPKLRELEAKLRRLKPATANVQRHRRHSRWLPSVAVCRLLSAVSLTATTVLVLVCLIPQRQPTVTVSVVESVAVADPVPQYQAAFPTMRQQLTQLLDEMDVADQSAAKTPEYPVIEIVVRNSPAQQSVVPPFRRWRWEEYDLIMF